MYSLGGFCLFVFELDGEYQGKQTSVLCTYLFSGNLNAVIKTRLLYHALQVKFCFVLRIMVQSFVICKIV